MRVTLKCKECGKVVVGEGNTRKDAEIDASYNLRDHQKAVHTKKEKALMVVPSK